MGGCRRTRCGAAGEAPNVVILPHAGWAYSGETAWAAVRAVRGAKFRRVVVLAPSHRAWIENRLVAPESDAVSTPLGEIRIDRDWLDRLALVAPVAKNDRIHAAEHAAQIEYPLLQLALGAEFTIVPLIIGSLGQDQMGMCARALARLMDAETLLVLSSDFTHYGDDFSYTPFGTGGGEDVRRKVAASDDEAFGYIAKGDAAGFAAFIKRTGATICGHVPIELALRAFPGGTTLVRRKYATSSDDSGDYSRFVCYVAATGCAKWQGEGSAVLSADDRAYLLRVARGRREMRTAPGCADRHVGRPQGDAGEDGGVCDAERQGDGRVARLHRRNHADASASRGCSCARCRLGASRSALFAGFGTRARRNTRRGLGADTAGARFVVARHCAWTGRHDA